LPLEYNAAKKKENIFNWKANCTNNSNKWAEAVKLQCYWVKKKKLQWKLPTQTTWESSKADAVVITEL